MADLLSHVLVAYSLGTILSWRYKDIKKHHITFLMIGAALPDLTRIALIIDPGRVGWITFNFFPLHTVIGVGITATILSTMVKDDLALPFLFSGALTHLFLDSLLINVTGHSYPMFWPVTAYAPPTPGLYLSTDVGTAMIAGAAAILVWTFHRKKL
ncbi:MAG: metal-dependent hydrolase [Thermoplasmata archaeon]